MNNEERKFASNSLPWSQGFDAFRVHCATSPVPGLSDLCKRMYHAFPCEEDKCRSFDGKQCSSSCPPSLHYIRYQKAPEVPRDTQRSHAHRERWSGKKAQVTGTSKQTQVSRPNAGRLGNRTGAQDPGTQPVTSKLREERREDLKKTPANTRIEELRPLPRNCGTRDRSRDSQGSYKRAQAISANSQSIINPQTVLIHTLTAQAPVSPSPVNSSLLQHLHGIITLIGAPPERDLGESEYQGRYHWTRNIDLIFSPLFIFTSSC